MRTVGTFAQVDAVWHKPECGESNVSENQEHTQWPGHYVQPWLSFLMSDLKETALRFRFVFISVNTGLSARLSAGRWGPKGG